MLPIVSMADELVKISADLATRKADAFHKTDEKNWNKFEKDLRSKGFQTAIVKHKKSDAKLKRYAKAYGGFLTSKDVVSGSPSRSSMKNYTIKRLPDGRLGCGCKDWQYKHSHKGTDCYHIKIFKESGLAKVAGLSPSFKAFRLGAKLVNDTQQNDERWEKGVKIRRQLRPV